MKQRTHSMEERGEMRTLIYQKDWSKTTLGPMEAWPSALRVAVDIMLGAGEAIGIYWGEDLVLLYNDLAREQIGKKHPDALGRPAREVFPEAWETLGPIHEQVMAGDGPVQLKENYLPLKRDGELEDIWWDSSFNPIPAGDGSVGGVLNISFDVTNRMRHIRETTERLAIALNAANMGTWEWDLEARTVRGDKTMMSLFDLPPTNKPVPIERFLEKQPAEGIELAENMMKASFEPGEKIQNEVHLQNGDFSRWIAWRGRASADDPSVLRGVSYDITKRKKREKELEKQMELDAYRIELTDKLRSLVDPGEIQQATARLLGKKLDADRVHYAVVEDEEKIYVHNEYRQSKDIPSTLGEHWLSDFGERISGRLRAGDNIVINNTKNLSGVNDTGQKTYEVLQTHSHVNVPLVKDGRLQAFFTVAKIDPHEWTETEIKIIVESAERTWAAVRRARAEKELRESKARLDAFVTTTSEVVYRMSPDWSEMYSLAGQGFITNTEEPRNTWIEDYIPEKERPRVLTAIHKAIETKSPFKLEHQILQVDGTLGWTYSRAVPMLNEDDEIVEWFGTATDITERKEIEEELKQRTKNLKAYQVKLRSLVHELSSAEENERRRLAGELHDNIAQMLAICKMKLDMMPNIENDATAISLDELSTLLDDAISYTRRLMNDLEPAVAGDEGDFKAALEWVAKKMNNHGLKVIIEDDGKPKLLGEKNRIMVIQIVRELLFNVLKHADTDQALVKAVGGTNHVQIIVQDEGKGFNPEQPKKYSKGKGGFGLFNIRERVNLVGGEFHIESEQGKGTRVALKIPLDSEKKEYSFPTESERATPETISEKSSINILIVEDHKMMRESIAHIINADQDMKIIMEAQKAEEALKILEGVTPDVVIMDINLPGINGIEATKIIKQRYPDIIIIGLSFHNERDTIEKIYKAGASGFISKDEALQTICKTIRDVVWSST